MATWDWGQTQTRRSDHRSPGPAGVHDTIAARLSRGAGGDAAGKAYSISGSNLNKLNSHCSRNHRRFVIAEQNVLTFMSQTQVHNIFAKISFCRIELATRYTMYIMHICLCTICTVIWLICSSGTCSRRENLLKLLGTCQRQRDGLSLYLLLTCLNGHLKCTSWWRCRSTRNSSWLLSSCQNLSGSPSRSTANADAHSVVSGARSAILLLLLLIHLPSHSYFVY